MLPFCQDMIGPTNILDAHAIKRLPSDWSSCWSSISSRPVSSISSGKSVAER